MVNEAGNDKRLTGRKVLIVDDDADVLAILKQAMQAEGALTQCCSDGNTAVHVCEKDPPDLILLDMMLPRRSGFLVLERVKQLSPPPIVIMVTGNEGKRHQAYAETLGVDAYMHKPLRLENLILTAIELLEERPEAQAVSAEE
ncbi:MAG: response regulator [Phycisphaerae bacterium]|nr:response regulator [Phycisphaerae bacterium]